MCVCVCVCVCVYICVCVCVCVCVYISWDGFINEESQVVDLYPSLKMSVGVAVVLVRA